jgi:hypothetical protein
LIRFAEAAKQLDAAFFEPGEKGGMVRHTSLISLGIAHANEVGVGYWVLGASDWVLDARCWVLGIGNWEF